MSIARLYTPAAVLCAGAILISGIREQYAVPARAPLSTIQSTALGLPGRDIVVNEEERKVAGMSEYMMRQYGTDSETSFSIYVGYYDRQVQGKTIHSPKNCLPGAGWEIMDATRIPSPAGAGTVNRVLLANKGVKALVYYWYQGRGRIESSEYVVKWNLLRDAALHGRTEEALVRIVVPVGTGTFDMARADSTATKVSRSLIPDVTRVMPTLETSTGSVASALD